MPVRFVSLKKKDTKRLARKHGLPQGSSLHESLEDAASEYQFTAAITAQHAGPAAIKKALREVRDRARELRESLRDIDIESYWQIHRSWTPASTRRQWRARLERDLRSLERSAERALARLPADRGGHPPDKAFHDLLDRLLDLYTEQTGKPLGLSRGGARHTNFHGRVFRFVADCLSLMGIRWANRALGLALQRRIKTRRQS